MTDTQDRAFVLGLDGVPWNLIEGWVDDGHLPNFGRLFEEGAAGPLRSTVPANTALAWPSIATGVWSDKHGLYGFYAIDEEYRHRMNTGEDRTHPALWDLLSPSVVGNVPMTYPAADVDGKMVTGMMTPRKNEGFARPASLREEIDERIPDYEIGLDWNDYHGERDRFLADLDDLLDGRQALMDLLMETEDWRLFFFVYTAPDRLQHLVWEEDVLLDHYRRLDDVLGDVMDYVEARGANLFVVSDHGFGPIDRAVYVNTVLEREGYLVRKDEGGTRGVLDRAGLTKERVLTTLDRTGLKDAVIERLPRSLVDSVAERIPGDHGRYDVEYANTTAFVHDIGKVYVNDTGRFARGTVDPADRDAVKAELESVFADLTDPETGERVLEVHDGAELFPTDDRAPDLVVTPREGYYVKTGLTGEAFADTGVHAGDHRPEGVFFGWGPDVAPGSRPAHATVVDVAPTVLHSLGEAVPASTDGRVLEEVFDPDGAAADRQVRTREYAATGGTTDRAGDDEDMGDVEDRLKGLGYME